MNTAFLPPMTPVAFPLKDQRFEGVEPSTEDVEVMCKHLGVTSKYGYSFVVYLCSHIITITHGGKSVSVEDFISQFPHNRYKCGIPKLPHILVSVTDAIRWFNNLYSAYQAHDMTWICV